MGMACVDRRETPNENIGAFSIRDKTTLQTSSRMSLWRGASENPTVREARSLKRFVAFQTQGSHKIRSAIHPRISRFYGGIAIQNRYEMVRGTLRRDDLELEFSELVIRWRKETGMVSMMHKKAMHPAYQRIIGMGKDALPFIFREMSQRGGHWIWALCAITGEDAAKPEHNLKQAVEAWLQWGKQHGHL